MGCLNLKLGLRFKTVPWLCGVGCVACVWHVCVACDGCMCGSVLCASLMPQLVLRTKLSLLAFD